MSYTDAVWQDDGRVSGAVCFRNTRVPVQVLFDYLRAGQSSQEFLSDFPGPTTEQVEAVLRACQEMVDSASPELLRA